MQVWCEINDWMFRKKRNWFFSLQDSVFVSDVMSRCGIPPALPLYPRTLWHLSYGKTRLRPVLHGWRNHGTPKKLRTSLGEPFTNGRAGKPWGGLTASEMGMSVSDRDFLCLFFMIEFCGLSEGIVRPEMDSIQTFCWCSQRDILTLLLLV